VLRLSIRRPGSAGEAVTETVLHINPAPQRQEPARLERDDAG